ncbi:MAG: HD domain-containing protein [Candidatus Krumholzibacteriota bacterium]|nr:HD domain-containing protein [Candidatus Krumholzibacteriota bacterium]
MSENLKVGDSVNKVMVVAKKVKRDFSNGKFFLFQFSDKNGTVKGVWWDPAREADKIKANDIVRVTGEVQEYQGTIQIRVNYMEVLAEGEYDPSVFLPSSSRDVESIYSGILEIIADVKDKDLARLLNLIFSDDRFKERFVRSPAAKGWHHSYVGGLAEHLYDMARIARAVAEVYSEVDRDLLITGVLLHDLGKMSELAVGNHIDYSDRGRLLGHISMGVTLFEEYLRGMEDFPSELEMKLKHMILSHHGQLDHGSPVVPMTVEALLLNFIDNMDAQARGTLMVLEKGGGEGRWSDYVRLLDRFIYRGDRERDIPDDPGDEDGDEDG